MRYLNRDIILTIQHMIISSSYLPVKCRFFCILNAFQDLLKRNNYRSPYEQIMQFETGCKYIHAATNCEMTLKF